MKRRYLPPQDARLKIQRSVSNAQQTLKNRNQKQFSRVPRVGKVQDARLKIRAKKFTSTQKNTLLASKTLSRSKQQVKKKTDPDLLPGRTINNHNLKRPGKLQPSSRNKPNAPLSDVSGFISVNDKHERVLMEKVTVHHSGMKIAVRNEFATYKRPPKRNHRESREEDKHIKITLDNPSANRSSPHSYSYRELRPLNRPSADRRSPLPRRRSSPPRPYPVPVRDHHSRTPSPPGTSLSEVPLFPRLTEGRYTLPPPQLQMGNGIRPMNSSETAEFRSTPRHQDRLREDDAVLHSPLEGTKILVSNLHPVVNEDDILELFSALGPVRRARMVGAGKAEVVFVRRDDAIVAYQRYNNRDLDGQPMQMKLLLQESPSIHKIHYSWMNDIGSRKKNPKPMKVETLQRALFKGGSTGTSTRPVVFTVKI